MQFYFTVSLEYVHLAVHRQYRACLSLSHIYDHKTQQVNGHLGHPLIENFLALWM